MLRRSDAGTPPTATTNTRGQAPYERNLTAAPPKATQAGEPDSSGELDAPFLGFVALILLTFLNIPSRLPAIGVIRPTLVLVIALVIACLARWSRPSAPLRGGALSLLLALVAYVLLSLPFVEWPGSVLNRNFEVFVKAVVFFFFTVTFVDTIRKLRILMGAYLGAQLFRVIEPLWLNVTEGYWGEDTYDGYTKWMDRLAGAPDDIIGANGLAFVIVSIIPFVHFWAFSPRTFRTLLAYCCMLATLLYTLVLTASRSGMVALVVVIAGIIALSRRRLLWIMVVVAVVALALPTLDPNQLERYQSLYRTDVQGAASAAGRFAGIKTDFDVAMRHPLFGHGLGTSREALFNSAGGTHMSHNFYTESLIELGGLGTAIILAYLVATWRLARGSLRSLTAAEDQNLDIEPILQWMPRALIVWTAMCLVFNLASYGISEYQWYFIGGLAVVVTRLIDERLKAGTPVPEVAGTKSARRPRSAKAATATSPPTRSSSP